MEWSCSVPERSLAEIQEMLIAEAANILSADPTTISVDTAFDSLGMSSMAFVELLVVIESAFDVKLMETDLSRDDFQSIGSLALRISEMK
jgi:acyl carrier protein